MTADLLRQAASRIRHDVEFGQAHGDDDFLHAVADLLDDLAYGLDMGLQNLAIEPFALRVADTYLGDPS